MAKPIKDYDVIIAGAGLVGLAAALALSQLGARVLVCDQTILNNTQPNLPTCDWRPLALSRSSQQILISLGLWDAVADVAQPITQVHVAQAKRFAKLRLSAKELQLAALGYVIPWHRLHHILWQQVQAVAHIDVQQQPVTAWRYDKQHIHVNENWRAFLLIAADGSHSALRAHWRLPLQLRDYKQHALVTLLQAENPCEGAAYERFLAQGPLAILPLREGYYGMVWAVSAQQATHWQQAPAKQFAQHLQHHFADFLGALQVVGKLQCFPLQQHVAQQTHASRMVLLGNAAHTVHPVAGQGFNLALRDVAALAQVLAVKSTRCWGDLLLLQQYTTWQRADQQRIIRATDFLARGFVDSSPIPAWLRGVGLMTLAALGDKKHPLLRYAMGQAGQLPWMACGVPMNQLAALAAGESQ